MQLNVTSLKGLEYEGDIISLNIKTTAGEITILDNHRPLVTVLEKCAAKITDTNGKVIEVAVNSGFLEVSPDNSVNVLID
ncbi:MAG: F0F1 ATP synthase subunit epsilon [Parcubacteria group bacterium]